MKDLIERQAVISALERDILDPPVLHDAIATIRELPTAEPERKNGMWMLQRTNDDGQGNVTFQVFCSKCGVAAYEFLQPYCHKCGAKMIYTRE